MYYNITKIYIYKLIFPARVAKLRPGRNFVRSGFAKLRPGRNFVRLRVCKIAPRAQFCPGLQN